MYGFLRKLRVHSNIILKNNKSFSFKKLYNINSKGFFKKTNYLCAEKKKDYYSTKHNK
jgi:hypothetical protein